MTPPHPSTPSRREIQVGSRAPAALDLRAAVVWLAILVPFAVTVLANGPAGGLIPHGTYHLVYLAIVCGAVYALLRWRSCTTSVAARRMMLLVAALQGFAAVGHIGEWASTLSDDRYEEPGVGLLKGDEALHTAFANVTVPALVLSIALVIATTIVLARRARPAR